MSRQVVTQTPSQATEVGFYREDWAAAYQNAVEHPEGYWLEAVHGDTIPDGLGGTYFRNGPGMFQHGDDRVAHPFDGHGLVASIAFHGGRAYFRSCFVRTKEYQDETSQQRILYKGTFGTLCPGGLLPNLLQIAPRNVANTGLLTWGGKCLALFEAGQPHSLDAATLQTDGISLLGGTIKAGAPFSTGWTFTDWLAGRLLGWLGVGRNMPGGLLLGGDAVSAHPVEDPATQHVIIFTFRLQLGLIAYRWLLWGWMCTCWLPGLVTKLSVREYDRDFVQLSVVHKDLPGYAFLHDLSVSAGRYVIFQNPVQLRMLPLLLGTLCPVHCIDWTSQPSHIHLLPRPATAAHSLPVSTTRDAAQLRQENVAAGVQQAEQLQTQQLGPGSPEAACQVAKEQRAADSVHFRGDWFMKFEGRQAAAGKAQLPHEKDLHCGASAGSAPRRLRARRQQISQNWLWRPPRQWQAEERQEELAASNGSSQTVGTAEPAFVFHQANAYEEGQQVVVDCVRYPEMPDFKQASSSGRSFVDCVDPDKQPISQLWRYAVDTKTGHVKERMLSARAMEFPAINPAYTGMKHRFLYAAAALHPTANQPQQALAKLDLETGGAQLWSRGCHFYVGEPVFARSPGGTAEDDGWILAVCYNACKRSSECIILDARNLEAGPVATLPLGHALPHGLHGTWDAKA